MLALTRRAAARASSPGRRCRPSPTDAPTNTLVLKTKHGKVVIKLRPDLAPKHVAQIKTLVARISTTASCSIG